MNKEQELLIALGIMAYRLTQVEDDLQKTTVDRDFWRSQWDKLRFDKEQQFAAKSVKNTK